MRNGIAGILAVATSVWLAGCDTNAVQSQSSMLRYQVDSASNRAWQLTHDGVVVQRAAEATAVVVPLPGWLWVGGVHGCPPDLALGPKGEAIVTSNVVPILWRIDPETYAVTVHHLILQSDADRDVGFSSLVYSAEQAAFVAYSDVQRSLWKIDPLLTTALKIAGADPLAARKGQRSGNVRSTPCTDLTWRLGQLASSRQ